MMKRLAVLLLTLVAATSLGACSSATEPTGTPAYTITRSWSNGMEETASVYADGRVIMDHGDHTERVTIPADQMAELAAAAALEIPAGANSDDPIIGELGAISEETLLAMGSANGAVAPIARPAPSVGMVR